MYNKLYHTKDLSHYSFLITGGAGFIGSNLVEYLLKYGAKKVRVLDNFSTGSHANIEEFKTHSAFELLAGDIRNFEVCQHAMEGIDFVSHQAALGSVPRSLNDPLTTNEVNITGFLNVLVAAKEAGVKKMVYAASSSTYGDHPALPKVEDEIGNPLSPYAVTKYVNELYARVFSQTYDFHTMGLRYFNVFGPRQNPQGPYAAVIPLFIESVLKGGIPFINGDGNTSRDFTFVENAVQANVKGLLVQEFTKDEVINVACGERTTLNELWTYINEIAESDLKIEYREERKGDVKHSLADISKAAKLIGYQPGITIKTGLEIAFSWYENKSKIVPERKA